MSQYRKYRNRTQYKIRKVFEEAYAITIPCWIVEKYGEQTRFEWQEYGEGWLILKSGAMPPK